MLSEAQSAALRAEFLADPNGLGYAALVTAGDDTGLAALLNEVHPVGAAYSIYRKAVAVKDLLAGFVPSEFASLTTAQSGQLNLMFAGSGGTLDASDVNTRNIVTAVLAGKAGTIANFAVLVKKHGSRAEVLFGDGTVVTPEDCGAAR